MQPQANDSQPISIAARRASRSSEDPMSTERNAAYRRFALTVLGLDVQTLTNELRVRRIQRMPQLHVVSSAGRAA